MLKSLIQWGTALDKVSAWVIGMRLHNFKTFFTRGSVAGVTSIKLKQCFKNIDCG